MGQSVQCPSCGNVFQATTEAPPMVSSPPAEAKPVGERTQTSPRSVRRADDYDERDIDDYDERDLDDDDYPRRRRRRRDYEPHRGAMILVFGILGFFTCPLSLIFGPLAWGMGSGDLRKSREGRMDPQGEGLTKAGMICGIVATCLTLAACEIYGFIFLMVGAGGGRF